MTYDAQARLRRMLRLQDLEQRYGPVTDAEFWSGPCWLLHAPCSDAEHVLLGCEGAAHLREVARHRLLHDQPISQAPVRRPPEANGRAATGAAVPPPVMREPVPTPEPRERSIGMDLPV